MVFCAAAKLITAKVKEYVFIVFHCVVAENHSALSAASMRNSAGVDLQEGHSVMLSIIKKGC